MGSLTTKQIQTIECLIVEGLSVTDTASRLGIGRSTIELWLNGKGYATFKAAYQERLDLAAELGRRRLRRRLGVYLNKLDDIAVGVLRREDVGVASVRLRAIEACLNRAGLPAVTKQEMSIEDARRELAGLVDAAPGAGGEEASGGG